MAANKRIQDAYQVTDTQQKPSIFRRHRFQIAPMMDWTDRHCRFFHRLMSREALLYTEMITAEAVLHGPRKRLLAFSKQEHPLALQLGGSEPYKLAEAARIAAEYGYDEINLNVGCPSDRVQSGTFGACLMAEPERVAACVMAMKNAAPLPVTVKCRIGIDNQDIETGLDHFAGIVTDAGVDALIVHARKAWLSGLSPKDNRTIPPLNYDRVYRLKKRFPHLPVSINGGISSLAEAAIHLQHVDGVMLGRAAYQDPALLMDVDRTFFGENNPFTDPRQAVEAMIPYGEQHIAAGGKLSNVTRHMLGIFNGKAGARAFRRHLATCAVKPGATPQVVCQALEFME
jgi:tRNA-dihydrouridine synthase A